jgi:kynurenine formamidase
MGLCLIDNCDLENLGDVCAAIGRSEFLFTVGPLRVEHGTGSPVNPLAVL